MIAESALLGATAAATALLGAIVAGIAYRGYRRTGSLTMRYLSVGILLLTVGPTAVTYLLAPLAGLSDAAALLGVLLSTILGLLAIIYSLDGV